MVFARYQRMRANRTSWAGTSLIYYPRKVVLRKRLSVRVRVRDKVGVNQKTIVLHFLKQ